MPRDIDALPSIPATRIYRQRPTVNNVHSLSQFFFARTVLQRHQSTSSRDLDFCYHCSKPRSNNPALCTIECSL